MDSVSTTTTIGPQRKRQIIKADFKKTLAPVWTILKNSSDEVRNATYESIGTKVKQLGTSGSDEETPLQTLGFAIEGMPDFFTQDARLLVYIISDENDSSMATFTSKYYEAIITEGQMAPVTRYFATFSYQSFHVITQGTRPVYEDGILTGQIEYDIRTPVATAAICNSRHSPPGSVCEIENVVNQTTETSANYCDVIPGNSPGYLYSKCVMSSETKNEPTSVTQVVKDESLFYITRDQNNGGTMPLNTVEGKKARRQILHLGLRNVLNERFQENYLIAAQVNIPGQACTMGAGQSFSENLQEFSQVLPEGQFMASSICDASATSGQGLKKISERLETIISKTYRLIKAQNEVIQAVHTVTGNQKVTLWADQYKFEASKIEILDATITNFDRLEVDLKSI